MPPDAGVPIGSDAGNVWGRWLVDVATIYRIGNVCAQAMGSLSDIS